jgi:hypothetical protein
VSFSGGVVVAVVLLAPGFAVFIAFFLRNPNDRISVELESTSSALAVSIIGVGSVLSHLLWAALCVANKFFAQNVFAFAPPISPYTLHQVAFGAIAKLSESDIAAATLSMMAMLAIAFFLALFVVRSGVGRTFLDPIRYGWAARIIARARAKGGFASAFVLTSVEESGAFLGYEGAIDSLNLDSKKEVVSVSLVLVGRFLVTISPRGLTRSPVNRGLIPHLYIDRANIRNIAFNVFNLPGGDADKGAVQDLSGQK